MPRRPKPKPPNPSLRFPPQAAAAGAATPSASARGRRASGWSGRHGPGAQPAEPAEWKITLDAFNIHEGELHLTDAVSKLDYSMTGIAATVEGVEIPQQKDRPINLWLTVDNSTDGGWIRAKGPLVLQPLALEMSFRMGNVALAPLAPAVRSAAPITLQDGRVALSAQVHVLDKGGRWTCPPPAQAELTQFKARDESLKPALDVALQRLHLTADRLAMGPGQSNFTLDADGVQGNGKLAPEGAFTPQPLTLRTSVDLSALNVASFAPYFASSLNATVRAITLGAGRSGLRGRQRQDAALGRLEGRSGSHRPGPAGPRQQGRFPELEAPGVLRHGYLRRRRQDRRQAGRYRAGRFLRSHPAQRAGPAQRDGPGGRARTGGRLHHPGHADAGAPRRPNPPPRAAACPISRSTA